MTAAARPDNRRRAYWLKTLHEWHWVSSAICLIGMILFSVTGFTLNHASQIEARPVVTRLAGTIDETMRAQLEKQLPAAKALKGKAPLPPELQSWVQKHWASAPPAARPSGPTTRSTCRCRVPAATPGCA